VADGTGGSPGRSTATLGEPAEMPILLMALPEPAHLVVGMLERTGVAPPELIRSTSLETMRGLVAAGDGVAIIHQHLLRPAGLRPRCART